MANKNYYDIIGISKSASEIDITKAFNKKLSEINQLEALDKIPKLQTLIEAFSILSNQKKRADYDIFLTTGQAIIPIENSNQYTSTSLVERIKFETTDGNVEQKLPVIIEKVNDILGRVKDHHVILKYRGEQIGPQIPMEYAIALEAAGLLGAGMVRTIVANFGLKTLFDVEIVSKSEKHISAGDEHFQNGEFKEAREEYLSAFAMNKKSSLACLRLGVINKVQGNSKEAEEWFQKVISIDSKSEHAKLAKKHLNT